MTASTVDGFASIISADPTFQVDPIRVAQLVESVAGARRNDQELIDLMIKMNGTCGYSALHSVLKIKKSKRPSLDLFLSRWRAFRSAAPPVTVDEFVEAIVAKDLASLGALIGGRDAAKIRVDVSKLPLDLPRRPGQTTIGLLDISAAVGGASLRYLLEFFSLKPTIDTLHQAIASGDNESIHMIWSRVDQKITSWIRRELAKTAAGFHFVGAVNWILKDAPRGTREVVREFAIEHRLIDVIHAMAR
jgi:hypothetical protein